MLNEFSKKEAPIQGLAGMGGGVPSRLLTLASGEATYIDDVFSTFLYDGNNSTQTITNGIDLDGEGGLVWIKARNSSLYNHSLIDTERGATSVLRTNTTGASFTNSGYGTGFNSDGFGISSNGNINNGVDSIRYCSWTFRKCPGFFDIQTYTGNGTGGLSISHDLGSVPGFIIVKSTSLTEGWFCYHRSLGNTKMVALNGSGGAGTATQYWNDTSPTDSTFTVGTDSAVNSNGATYIAYLFAHNDGSFGEDSDEAVIKCGTYTGSSSYPNQVDVGFEPQWVLIKQTNSGGNWALFDMMRGTGTGGKQLYTSTKGAEATENGFNPTATGFELTDGASQYNGNGDTYIYIAIRRPHKPPEAATEVFTPVLASSSGDYTATAGFPVDLNFYGKRSSSDKWFWRTRLTGNGYFQSNNTNAIDGSGNTYWDSMTVFKVPGVSGDYSDYINYNFKRAPGFFDVVAYTGTGSARNINHNLTVEPELAIIKSKSATGSWIVGSTAFSSGGHLVLDESGGMNNVGSTTRLVYANWSSTVLGIGADSDVNNSGTEYVALLFASLDGVSKIGTYTGTGSDGINVDCGFTAGARLVIIKRTDSTGNWFCWDSARGIVSGNDPWLALNGGTEDATTDYIDPLDAGFIVNGSSTAQINASGGTYLFLAIA